MSTIIGIKTQYFTDVTLPVRAGMQFGTKNYKIKTIGKETTRLYFDTIEKDYQVGSQIIARKLL